MRVRSRAVGRDGGAENEPLTPSYQRQQKASASRAGIVFRFCLDGHPQRRASRHDNSGRNLLPLGSPSCFGDAGRHRRTVGLAPGRRRRRRRFVSGPGPPDDPAPGRTGGTPGGKRSSPPNQSSLDDSIVPKVVRGAFPDKVPPTQRPH